MTSRLWQMTDIVDVLEAWEARQSDRRQSLEEGLVPILINDPKHWRRRASRAVENNEHLAAFWRDLDAEAGASGVPVHYVRFGSRQRVDGALGQPDAGHGRQLSGGATFTSHR